MKKVSFIFLCFALCPFWAIAETTKSGGIFAPYETPIPANEWKTYSNSEYGFSIRYPLAGKKKTPKPHANMYAEIELDLPTGFRNDVVFLYAFTDAGVKDWNNFANNKDNEGDGEAFGYSLKSIREALRLSIGTKYKSLKYVEVVELKGVKALLFSNLHGQAYDYGDMDQYIIPRGENHWLQINIPLYNGNSDGWDGVKTITPEIQKERKRLAEALLKTLKFKNPFSKKAG